MTQFKGSVAEIPASYYYGILRAFIEFEIAGMKRAGLNEKYPQMQQAITAMDALKELEQRGANNDRA